MDASLIIVVRSVVELAPGVASPGLGLATRPPTGVAMLGGVFVLSAERLNSQRSDRLRLA
jgi:hypothetical protein